MGCWRGQGHLLSTPGEVSPELCFYRYPEEMEKEEQAIAGKDITKEECQGEWAAPAPEFTATQPKVETGLQVYGPPCWREVTSLQ